ncbi:ABC transporter substrate-binding protein [Mesorhizobium sp. 8]|nr:ABC transporter substrate-binding protein [Mesorhizobium sp. 8]
MPKIVHSRTSPGNRPVPRIAGFFRRTLVTLVAASCLASPTFAQENPVVIGVSSRSFNPGFSNMWIGIPLGLYGDKIAPSAVGTQGAAENLQLMLSGQVTMSTGTQDVILNAAAEGRRLPVVMPCVYLRGLIHRVSVAPDSEIRSYADLKGKRIGVPTLAYGGVGYLNFATHHVGLSVDDFQLVAVGDGQQAAAALASGEVDALVNADVDVARIQKLGVPLRVVEPPESLQGVASAYVFAFSKPWFEGHKDQAAELLKGMIRAIVVMLENPEAAVRISYFMHPEAIPSGISFDKAVADAVETINIRAPAIEREVGGSNRWCDFPDQGWESFAKMLGIDGKVDPRDFYTDELIAAVNDINEPELRKWARELQVPEGEVAIKSWLAVQKPPL